MQNFIQIRTAHYYESKKIGIVNRKKIKQIIIIPTCTIVNTYLDMTVIKYIGDIPMIICIKNKHDKLFNDRQFLLLTQIMIIFEMKSCTVITLIIKYR